jgi:N-methylhydantoinase A/oxoprolinase/acetone carboxylase beta subunit
VEVEKSGVRRRSRHRKAYFERCGLVDARVELLEALPRGSTVEGPAIIETALTTIVVDPDARAHVHDRGCVIVTSKSHIEDCE